MLNEYPNILLVGKMCSGKSTAAKILEDKYGYTRIGFAKSLKEIESRFNEFTTSPDIILDKGLSIKFKDYLLYYVPEVYKTLSVYELDELELICTGMKDISREEKPRKRYQYLGENARKMIDKNIWIRLLKAQLGMDKHYVIDDCRYFNELDSLPTWEVIKISVSKEKQSERIRLLYGSYNNSILTHESEVDVDKMDIPEYYTINGDLDINDFKQFIISKVNNIINNHKRLRVYLAGPISYGDIQFNYLWREELRKKLRLLNCYVFDPTEYEPRFETREQIYNFVNTGDNGYKMFSQDLYEINKADVILIYESVVSKGTSIEQGIARMKKPIIYVSEDKYLRDHPFVRYSSNWIFSEIDEAINLIKSITSNQVFFKESLKALSFDMKNTRGSI